MNRPQKSKFYRTLALITSLPLSLAACDWVDSTGKQAVSGGSDFQATLLEDSVPLALLEQNALTVNLAGDGAGLTDWRWELLASGDNAICSGIDGFDAALAAPSLTEACTTQSQCRISIDESSDPSLGTTRFTLLAPTLKAPVAMNFALSTTGADGIEIRRQQPFCGLSINEAPIASDDAYVVLRGSSRIVTADDADNLLANDSDDLDVRNQPLQVSSIVAVAPSYAAEFLISDDGGFVYQPMDNLPVTEDGIIADRFVYSVSDGQHVSQATAHIRISTNNQPPELDSRIPDQRLEIPADSTTTHEFAVQLNDYFIDLDNDVLVYSIQSSPSLPDFSVENGELAIRAALSDTGRYRITVTASDGLASTSDRFDLRIIRGEAASGPNQPPIASDIRNRIVQNRFTYDVSGFFTDPDDDELMFTATGLPDDVTITSDGTIEGAADDDNEGAYFIRVTATDEHGASVSDGFLLVIS